MEMDKDLSEMVSVDELKEALAIQLTLPPWLANPAKGSFKGDMET